MNRAVSWLKFLITKQEFLWYGRPVTRPAAIPPKKARLLDMIHANVNTMAAMAAPVVTSFHR